MSKRYSGNLKAAHAYVHAPLDEAGQTTNTSFGNGIFYSYSTPIAAKVASVVLLTTEHHSNTTAKHKCNLRTACVNVCEIILARYIPHEYELTNMARVHKMNVEYFFDTLQGAIDAFVKTNRSRVGKGRELVSAFENLETYANVFNLGWDNSPFIYQVVNLARTEVTVHNDKEVRASNISLKGKDLQEAHQKMVKESFRKWCAGETNKLPLNNKFEKVALRVTESLVETSQAACMPKADVARIWPDLKAMWQSCSEEPTFDERMSPTKLLQRIATSNPTMQFGQFRGVYVTKAFIRIGCHDIPWSEVVDVAKQLGLDVTGVEDATTN